MPQGSCRGSSAQVERVYVIRGASIGVDPGIVITGRIRGRCARLV
jgi:hypothetical protein